MIKISGILKIIKYYLSSCLLKKESKNKISTQIQKYMMNAKRVVRTKKPIAYEANEIQNQTSLAEASHQSVHELLADIENSLQNRYYTYIHNIYTILYKNDDKKHFFLLAIFFLCFYSFQFHFN